MLPPVTHYQEVENLHVALGDGQTTDSMSLEISSTWKFQVYCEQALTKDRQRAEIIIKKCLFIGAARENRRWRNGGKPLVREA